MKIPDVNVLLYARDASAAEHQRARDWIDTALSSREPTGFATVVVLGFIRISTNARLTQVPLAPAQAFDHVEEWLSAPFAALIHPQRHHLAVCRELLERTGTAGNLTTDAHLAALAIEREATLASFDGDFHRFARLAFEYLGAGH